MNRIVIDNSLTEEIRRTILWQYDKAKRLIELLGLIGGFYSASTQEFWDGFPAKIDVMGTDSFSLTVWACIFGIGRPVVSVDGVQVSVSDALFRRILSCRTRLIISNASLGSSASETVDRKDAYQKFCDDVFLGKVTVVDGYDMSMEFRWIGANPPETAAEKEMYALVVGGVDKVIPFPAGVRSHDQDLGPVLGFDTQVRGDGDSHVFVSMAVEGDSAVTIPAGSKFTLTSGGASIVYSTGSEAVIPAGSVRELLFSREGSGALPTIEVGTEVTVTTSAGAGISGISDVRTSTVVLPDEQSSDTMVAVRMYSAAPGVEIPEGAKFTLGSDVWTMVDRYDGEGQRIVPKTEEHEGVCWVEAIFRTEGAKYVRAREVVAVTDSSGQAIAGVTAATNPRRSMTDFLIGGLDDSSFAWR